MQILIAWRGVVAVLEDCGDHFTTRVVGQKDDTFLDYGLGLVSWDSPTRHSAIREARLDVVKRAWNGTIEDVQGCLDKLSGEGRTTKEQFIDHVRGWFRFMYRAIASTEKTPFDWMTLEEWEQRSRAGTLPFEAECGDFDDN